MKRDRIDEVLEATLDDDRLSRSERKALRKVIDDGDFGDADFDYTRHRIFTIARARATAQRERTLIDWIEDAVKVFGRPEPAVRAPASEVHFSPGDHCWRRIVGLFEASRRKIDVCVFTITDNRIARAMVAAHQRGVALRVISDNDKARDTGSDIMHLMASGIPVRLDRSEHHMHHKFAVFDDATVLTGSYNWTRSAANHNRENLIVLTEPAAVVSYLHEFDDLWAEGSSGRRGP